MIEVYEGETYSLPLDERHAVFKWSNGKCFVLFSAIKHGTAISAHIYANGRLAKANLRTAVNEFCDAMFKVFDWCTSVTAQINASKKSVINLCKKCGFEDFLTVTTYNDKQVIILARLRNG